MLIRRTLIRRTSAWILGTAMAAAVAHSTRVTQMAATFADAFEPDLDAWEYIPVAPVTVAQAG